MLPYLLSEFENLKSCVLDSIRGVVIGLRTRQIDSSVKFLILANIFKFLFFTPKFIYSFVLKRNLENIEINKCSVLTKNEYRDTLLGLNTS